MNLFLLRSLLIFALVGNGLATPWAVARMAHEHAGHTGMTPAAVVADAPMPMRHRVGATAVAEVHQRMPMGGAGSGDCCDGTTCQCGCVLPPIILSTVVPLVPPGIVGLPPLAHCHQIVATDDTPPFRPPVV